MKKSNAFKLITSLLIPFIAAGIGAIFTEPSVPTWYAGLVKPSFNPPNWLFGPVWTALYLMMGTSLFLVWKKGAGERGFRSAIIFFAIQMALNSLWSILFFGMKSPLAGFIEIVFLWIFILCTIVSFYRISRPAGILLVPYIIWVSFAAALNFFLWRLNS
jgi:benzodiazapine receptor